MSTLGQPGWQPSMPCTSRGPSCSACNTPCAVLLAASPLLPVPNLAQMQMHPCPLVVLSVGEPDWQPDRVDPGSEDEQGGGLGRHDLPPVRASRAACWCCCMGGAWPAGQGHGGGRRWVVDGLACSWRPAAVSCACSIRLNKLGASAQVGRDQGLLHLFCSQYVRLKHFPCVGAGRARPRTRSLVTWLWAWPPARSRPARPAAPSACPSTTRCAAGGWGLRAQHGRH